ncbi:MAG: hypothetical protein Q4Q24_00595 [Methanobrevibacter ruminantium]|uniref:hypothetical protein n=1 Tax=Methanobrevibacter ruminantium TaxID=83816 RepID=UPI0026EA6753|nr:hypothetical protein [Methanobrevibacter ruminantium]MDO5841753.1 hypothetical protein [Methanobrevibacter ruminantium]
MKDYNIYEVIKILNNHDPNDLKIIPHLQERWLERDFRINYIVDCISNEIPLSISKTRMNRFKLVYPHETKITMDLYVIIEIDENSIITIITAYPNDKRRREREG